MDTTFAYNAFGEAVEPLTGITSTTGIDATNYLYTGQQFNTETELYSLRARSYDPVLGRFLSRDEYAYDYQNPVELNRYVYAANNPVMFSDPSGYFASGCACLYDYNKFITRISAQL